MWQPNMLCPAAKQTASNALVNTELFLFIFYTLFFLRNTPPWLITHQQNMRLEVASTVLDVNETKAAAPKRGDFV